MLTMDVMTEVGRLQDEMHRVFETVAPLVNRQGPTLNVWAGENQLKVTTELPGIGVEKLDVSVSGNVLTIRGSYPEPVLKEGERWIRKDGETGKFVRTFELPFRVEEDKVEATYQKGILTLTLPRAEREKPRRIEIKAS